jgi:hypothetical protein
LRCVFMVQPSPIDGVGSLNLLDASVRLLRTPPAGTEGAHQG